MDNPTSLKQLIQRLMPRQPEVIMGRTISEEPLIIQAENDEKLKLSKSNSIIPKKFYDCPLRIGEKVHILVLSDGKKHYILDRA